MDAPVSETVEVPCICRGENPACVLCEGTGQQTKVACPRCQGKGQNGGRPCLDCRGRKSREPILPDSPSRFDP